MNYTGDNPGGKSKLTLSLCRYVAMLLYNFPLNADFSIPTPLQYSRYISAQFLTLCAYHYRPLGFSII